MGPVNPVWPPTSAGFTGCWVWLASAVGTGLSELSGLREITSKRGMGVVNACTPKRGLAGIPVGMLLDVPPPLPPLEPPEPPLAYATKGLNPLTGAITPAVVNK